MGGIKVGSGLSINPESGVLSATGGGTADSVDWANITSIPETFKPEAHQHVTTDITDLQDKLDAKADTTAIADMATKTWVGEQGFLTSHQDISQLATKQELTEGLSGKQDKGNYITVESANEKYQVKGDYATKTELEGKVDNSEIADMATKTYVSEQGFLTEHQDISGLATKEEVTSGLESKQDKGNYLTVENAASTYQPKGNYITDESDPTVPSWAKSPTKPTYSASEVGAIAKGGLKTINGQSLEGSGDIELAGGGSDWVIKELPTNKGISISNPFAEKKTIYKAENNVYFDDSYINIDFGNSIPSDYREVKIVVQMYSKDDTASIYFYHLPSNIKYRYVVSVPGLGVNKVIEWDGIYASFLVDLSGLLDSEKLLNVVILMDNYGVTVL